MARYEFTSTRRWHRRQARSIAGFGPVSDEQHWTSTHGRTAPDNTWSSFTGHPRTGRGGKLTLMNDRAIGPQLEHL